MGAISGERYLRLLIERVVAQGHPDESHVRSVASALVAARALDATVAANLQADASLAMTLRRPDALGRIEQLLRERASTTVGAGDPPPGPVSLTPVRVAAGPAYLTLPEGTLTIESIVLDPVGTIRAAFVPARGAPSHRPTGPTFGANPAPRRPLGRPTRIGRPPAGGASWAAFGAGGGRPPVGAPSAGTSRGPRRAPGPGDPWPHLTIADDRGRTYTARTSGASGGDPSWTVCATLTPQVADAARWLEIGGPDVEPARLAIPGAPSDQPQVTLPLLSPGEWYLFAQAVAATANQVRHGEVPRTLPRHVTDALIAVGALDPLSLELEPSEKDPRFASAISRRGITSDRSAVWPLGTVADLGEVSLRIDACVARAGRLEVHAALGGWPGRDRPGTELPVAVTAEDNRGGWYVGYRWRSMEAPDGAGTRLTLELAPDLDPAAQALHLVVTGRDGEATFVVSLT